MFSIVRLAPTILFYTISYYYVQELYSKILSIKRQGTNYRISKNWIPLQIPNNWSIYAVTNLNLEIIHITMIH